MASALTRDLRVMDDRIIALPFQFSIATGAATLVNSPFVASFAKQATGKYDGVLVADAYSSIVGVLVTTVQGAAHDGAWHLHTDLGSGTTFSLGHTDFETPALTDPADATYRVILFVRQTAAAELEGPGR